MDDFAFSVGQIWTKKTSLFGDPTPLKFENVKTPKVSHMHYLKYYIYNVFINTLHILNNTILLHILAKIAPPPPPYRFDQIGTLLPLTDLVKSCVHHPDNQPPQTLPVMISEWSLGLLPP